MNVGSKNCLQDRLLHIWHQNMKTCLYLQVYNENPKKWGYMGGGYHIYIYIYLKQRNHLWLVDSTPPKVFPPTASQPAAVPAVPQEELRRPESLALQTACGKATEASVRFGWRGWTGGGVGVEESWEEKEGLYNILKRCFLFWGVLVSGRPKLFELSCFGLLTQRLSSWEAYVPPLCDAVEGWTSLHIFLFGGNETRRFR